MAPDSYTTSLPGTVTTHIYSTVWEASTAYQVPDMVSSHIASAFIRLTGRIRPRLPPKCHKEACRSLRQREGMVSAGGGGGPYSMYQGPKQRGTRLTEGLKEGHGRCSVRAQVWRCDSLSSRRDTEHSHMAKLVPQQAGGLEESLCTKETR